ncbi:MAG TPA: nucleoside hydrolase [Candidatus Limnocylindria bacterium]|nr:nucleoside hydrolase [Candidatus Limnocylindria bacterium]
MTRRIVLDCDPGHDDALAILLAAAHPGLELAAITTVAGNQTLDKVTLNARRVCSVAGIAHVPIAAGCDRPLVREQLVAGSIHGTSGLDGPDWPEPGVGTDDRHAVDLLLELSRGGSPLSVVAVGPLTNVATALDRDPGLAGRLERVVLMGGAIGLGNWTPSAEFNILADPEAAQAVFASGVPITMVPLEVTHQALATDAVLARIDALDTRVGRMAADLLRFFAETYQRVFGFAAPAVHDPCAVACVIDPTIVTTRAMNVEVDTTSELSYGRTVCDVYGTTGRTPNAEVGTALDVERFWELLIGALASYAA